MLSVCFYHSATVRLDTVWLVDEAAVSGVELSVSDMDVRFIRGRKPCRLGGPSPFVGVTLIVIT